MLRNFTDLQGYALRSTDGDIGTVKDFYFDDERWVVRYLVVETGTWLSSRKVLIATGSLGVADPEEKVVPVSITREQVRNSPDIDTDKPVSRQHELDYLGYYGYPVYWDGMGLMGSGGMAGGMLTEGVISPAAVALADDPTIAAEVAARHRNDDPHLRSCKSVTGYQIKAQDGEIGHVKGFIFDEQSWQIRYMVVDTGNWLSGHQVLVAPPWIHEVSWEAQLVAVTMTREAIEKAPKWDASMPPDRDQEVEIYKHYDRTGYW